jgi:hypothetical protein
MVTPAPIAADASARDAANRAKGVLSIAFTAGYYPLNQETMRAGEHAARKSLYLLLQGS